jgi:hypothetical protein
MNTTPNSQLSSTNLAALIIDVLVDAKIVAKSDVARAIELATVEIDVRKAMTDYWCSICAKANKEAPSGAADRS